MSLSDPDYDYIRKLVYEHSRIDLGARKRELVAARLGKRFRVLGLPDYADYFKLLKSKAGAAELPHLIDAISTNHTFFFREMRHFEFLREAVLAPLARQEAGAFRVWSAASSSGEEPYSIAIELAAFFQGRPEWHWSIDGSDISTRILEQARAGIYAADRVREVPPAWLRAHFQKGVGKWTGHFRIKEALRKKVRYTHLNLLQAEYPFPEPFHVIWCRNVMIYFDRTTQEQLVGHLARHLVPGGYLFIGHSESLTGIRHGLKPVKPAIYQKPV